MTTRLFAKTEMMSLVLVILATAFGCQPRAESPEKAMPTGALPGGDCMTSWQCREFGHCTPDGDWCVVGSDLECAGSLGCALNGWCAADTDTGWCVAKTAAHCEASQICTTRGACTPHGPCCSQNCVNNVLEDTWSENADKPPTYTQVIQPIYQHHCTPCHAGDTPEGCAGGTCFVSFYEAIVFDSTLCEETTMGECSLQRLLASKDLSDDIGLIGSEVYIIIPAPEIGLLTEWVALGMPE